MANISKYFKGTVEEFTTYMNGLKDSNMVDSSKRYSEIFDSVVYISEHINQDPDQAFLDFDGAIYAHGAIIKPGSDLMWSDDELDLDASVNEPRVNA